MFKYKKSYYLKIILNELNLDKWRKVKMSLYTKVQNKDRKTIVKGTFGKDKVGQ